MPVAASGHRRGRAAVRQRLLGPEPGTKEAGSGGYAPGVVATSDAVIILAEEDSSVIGRPMSMKVSSSTGEIFVLDAFISCVFRFGRDGVLRSVIARPGSGPGEITQAGDFYLTPDDVIIADQGTGMMKVFSRKDGSFLKQVPFAGTAGYGVAQERPELILGLLNRQLRTTFATWDPGAPALSYYGVLPARYTQTDIVGGVWPYISVALHGDTVLVLPQAADSITYYTLTGARLRTVVVPRRIRRGVVEDVKRLDQMPFNDAFNAQSAVFGLHVFSDGSLLIIHYDLERTPPTVQADIFATRLAGDGTPLCVDSVLGKGHGGTSAARLQR